MPVNDPIADLLVRIRNAANAKFDTVTMPHSKLREAVARIMQAEGFVSGVEVMGEGARKSMVVELKYTEERKPVFNEMKRTSKLGRRVYLGAGEIRPSRQGMGVAILTTSKGVMKDTDAKRAGVGGEVLCTIW
ncbi:MAG TPA: 30S ribosomal protein S8 [bacterium]|nr:30S ribosomal protein S8 [bacterium]